MESVEVLAPQVNPPVNPEQQLAALLIKHKLDKGTVLDKIRLQLDATRILPLGDGEYCHVPDNASQLKAVELCLKLHGLIDRQPTMSVGAINILWHGPAPRWIPGEADGPGPGPGARSINGENEPIDNGTQPITEGMGEVDLKVLGSDPGVSPPTRSTKSICPPYIPVSERSHGVSDKVNVAPPLVKRIKRGKR